MVEIVKLLRRSKENSGIFLLCGSSDSVLSLSPVCHGVAVGIKSPCSVPETIQFGIRTIRR